jgi:hypothetical protein
MSNSTQKTMDNGNGAKNDVNDALHDAKNDVKDAVHDATH